MKLFIRLAILVATFLLITNMAFAITCDEEVCYNSTSIFSNGSTSSAAIWVCLNDDATGAMLPIGVGPVPVIPLALFGGGPHWFDFDAHPKWTTWILSPDVLPVSGYIWLTEGGYYFNGEGISSGARWIMKGVKVPCPAP